MNCKPGDLAVIVKTTGDACGKHGEISRLCIGRIVRVTHLRRPTDPNCTASQVWNFEEPLAINLGGETYHVSGCDDSVMLPIRDQPGEDEMLRIAGLPQELPVDLIKREAERV